MTPSQCPICKGLLWVCENHPDKPWDIDKKLEDGCTCGAGMNCECNPGGSFGPGFTIICQIEDNLN